MTGYNASDKAEKISGEEVSGEEFTAEVITLEGGNIDRLDYVTICLIVFRVDFQFVQSQPANLIRRPTEFTGQANEYLGPVYFLGLTGWRGRFAFGVGIDRFFSASLNNLSLLNKSMNSSRDPSPCFNFQYF